jgi:gluconolactonase
MLRHILGCLAAVSVLSLCAQAADDQGIQRLDPALDKLLPKDAKVEKLGGNLLFTEGPVWDRRAGYLLFSDVPGNAIMKWTTDGKVSVFRKDIFTGYYPAGFPIGPNGTTIDPQGRLVFCEHGNRRISRLEKNGSLTVLADRYEGKRLNSPNDIVSTKSGDIYFTDPPYGLFSSNPPDPEKDHKQELDFAGIFRIRAGKLEVMVKIQNPNGLAFTPDGKKIYLSQGSDWVIYDVKPDGTFGSGRVFYQQKEKGGPDGFKVDKAGNVWSSSGPKGISIISPQGKLLGVIAFPEEPANCAFGDADGKSLYVTARAGLYRIRTNIQGLRP